MSEETIYPLVNDHQIFLMDKPYIGIWVAKPESGKSVSIKYNLYRLIAADNISHGWVFTGTDFNDAYDFVPKKFVSSKFTIDKLEAIKTFQKANPAKRPAFIVFDDMVSMIPWTDPVVQDFFMNYRHYNVRIIISSQYFKKIPPTIREQTTFYIIFGRQADLSLEAIAAGAFAGMRKDRVARILNANMSPYMSIIVNLNAENEEDIYQRFKAPLIDGIHIDAWWTDKDMPKGVKVGQIVSSISKVATKAPKDVHSSSDEDEEDSHDISP